VPTEPKADQLLADIQRAKEAYLLVLRQAFVDGLDPRLLVQRGILNRAFNQPPEARTIDLTDPPLDLRDIPDAYTEELADDVLSGLSLSHYLS
jgi:hypothetical protein